MNTGNLKSKVERVGDAMWPSGVLNQLAEIDADLERAEDEVLRIRQEVTT